METVLSLLFVGATVTLVLGIAVLATPQRARRRLERLADGANEVPQQSEGRESLIIARDQGAVTRLLEALGGRASVSDATVGPLRQRMIHAGYRKPSALPIYFGIRLVLALGLPALFLATPFAWTIDQIRVILIALILAGVGYVAPSWWVDRRKSSRQGQIERTLPDALDLMVVCVEAGYGINASLARVADEFAESSPVLSHELGLVVQETRAGKTTTESLRRLADRTGVSDISALVALLVQTEQFGTSVAHALRVHADAMRVRRLQRAEERAQKAPLKMIFPTSLIFLGLLLIFLVPSLSRLSAAFGN